MASEMLGSTVTGLDHLEIGGLASEPSRGWQPAATRVWRALWPKLGAIALVLAVWQLVYLSRYKSPIIFPAPGTVFASLWDQAHHLLLWQAIGTTLRRAVLGFGLALIIGSVIGAVVSRTRPLRAAFGSLITGLQTMPSIAWFPFAIIFFSPTNAAIMFVMVLGAAPSIANGLIAGVDYTPPLLLRAGKTMGLRGIALYRHLILPASLPTYVAGLKQGWAFSWRSLMAGELLVIIAGSSSIGVLLDNAQSQLDMAGAESIMIVILIIGIAVDAAFGTVDRSIRKRRGLSDAAVGT